MGRKGDGGFRGEEQVGADLEGRGKQQQSLPHFPRPRLYDSLHEGGVHVFDESEDEDHFLARVFEDEPRVGVAPAAQHIRCHDHRQ